MTQETTPHDDRVPGGSGFSVADRLERLPFSGFHRNFLLMVTAGEFVETLMLLGNGVVLALVAKVLNFSPAVSTWAIPVSFFVGEFCGAIASGYVADKLGRKQVFVYDLLVFGIGMILAGFMSNAALIALFVFIGGIGVGGEFPVVDTYTAEMFPGRDRGRRMATVYTIAVLAAPIIAALAYIVSHPAAGPDSWRILMWTMGALGLIVWIIRFKVPESPRWYESTGQYEKADALMTQIEDRVKRERGLSELPPVAESVRVTPSRARYSDIFAPDLRKRTVMMLVFQFFQSGIFYGFTALAPTFLLTKGISLVHTLLFSMIIYAGFFVGSVVSIFIIDKVERKHGIIATAITAGVLGTLFAVVANTAVVVVLGFLTTFTLWMFSNFLHTYQAEVFPTRVRSTAAGTVYSVSRVSTSLFTYIITTIFLPHGLLPTFGLIWVFIVIVVADIAVFGPRTSQLKVEEIAQ
ncbi:MAG: MFS transporter [Streptosporangiales bacterium]|nr:MFS transporter [Streptosporangiales bacterium]